MSAALLIPVPLVAARAWALGWIGDFELMTGPLVPEAVYFSGLPDLRAFRRCLPQFHQYHQQGARAVILRTNSPAVVHHVEKWGAMATHIDPSGRARYWAGPDVVARYFGRMAQKAAAASGVTS